MYFRCFLILSLAVIALCLDNDFKGFDDTIIFGINWPGAPENLENIIEDEAKDVNKPQFKELLKVTTSNKEQYQCQIPEALLKGSWNIEEYNGPSPMHLLKSLFAQKICSYRLESYWSYEVCHGRYVRQYHEEREGKQVKTQEYFLGHWNSNKQAKLDEELNSDEKSKEKPKTIKMNGVSLPSVELVMEEGTTCDLNGKPRLTRVNYVCYVSGKHEVFSFKETSTCEYEIIILSPLLCEHPYFKPEEVSENIINCSPVGNSPIKPKDLLKMESESLRFHHQSIRLINNDNDAKDVVAVLRVEAIEKDGETQLKFNVHPRNDDFDPMDYSRLTYAGEGPPGDGGAPAPGAPGAPASAPAALPAPPVTGDSPVRAFLNGVNCLTGGTGWWKYEFCYGKHVIQYHLDRVGDRTTLLLGKFNEEAHLEWIRMNRGKVPKPIEQRTSISHFYSGGDICDKTGMPRQTEVKLKCLENSSSPAQVSLYLLEPRTCHYILGVESPLICDILHLANENGLITSLRPQMMRQEPVAENKETDQSQKASDVPKVGNN